MFIFALCSYNNNHASVLRFRLWALEGLRKQSWEGMTTPDYAVVSRGGGELPAPTYSETK